MLTSGTEGILQKDWEVHVSLHATSASAITTFKGSKTKINADAIITAMGASGNGGELGECRADSIESALADGDKVTGNKSGEITLNKAGSFTAELMNMTPANIACLEALDGQACDILMKEVDTHGSTMKTIILIENHVISYAESIKQQATGTITVARKVARASAWRTLSDVSYA